MPQTEEAVQPACKPSYTRLTRADIGRLVKMRDAGMTQAAIAQQLGCTQQTISLWLADLTDTTAESKLYLRGQSLRMAQNIVKKGRAADHVAALKGLGVLEEQQGNGLTIVIGGSNHDVKVAVLNSPSPQVQIEPGESAEIT